MCCSGFPLARNSGSFQFKSLAVLETKESLCKQDSQLLKGPVGTNKQMLLRIAELKILLKLITLKGRVGRGEVRQGSGDWKGVLIASLATP